jgi:hypothetical protein
MVVFAGWFAAPLTPTFTTVVPIVLDVAPMPNERKENSTVIPSTGASYELFHMVASISYSVPGSRSCSGTTTPFRRRMMSGLSQVTGSPSFNR